MTYPLIGNHGRFARRRPVRATLAARPRGQPRDRRRARPGAPDRAPAALRRACPRSPGLDTRALARHLRETGCQRGDHHGARRDGRARRPSTRARALPRWEDQDFVSQVSVAAPYEAGDRGPLVAVVDYGLKANIVRSLRRRGARVRVLPHTATAADVLRPDVSGVVLSPGPGDPVRLEDPIALARAVIADGRPLLGICLGHQIVARAAGAETRRLRFGHHGANHPVEDLGIGPGAGHGPEPRGHGRRRTRCRAAPASRSASATSTTAASKGCATTRCPSRPSSTTRRARPARSTRSRSSTASWRASGPPDEPA